MAGFIADRDRQRLADGRFDGNRHRDVAHRRTRGVRFLRAFHQRGIVDLEHAVVVAHGRRDGKGDDVACFAGFDFPALRVCQSVNRRRHAAADLDPEVHLVAEGQTAA